MKAKFCPEEPDENVWWLQREQGDPHSSVALASIGLEHYEMMEDTYEFPSNSPDDVRACFVGEGWEVS